jgi:hypothetical protein
MNLSLAVDEVKDLIQQNVDSLQSVSELIVMAFDQHTSRSVSMV